MSIDSKGKMLLTVEKRSIRKKALVINKPCPTQTRDQVIAYAAAGNSCTHESTKIKYS